MKIVFGGRAASSLRFVLSVRDPVTRTVSYFNHAVTNNWANLRRRQRREPNFSFGLWVQEELNRLNACVAAAAAAAVENRNATVAAQSETFVAGMSIEADPYGSSGSGHQSKRRRKLSSTRRSSSTLNHQSNDDNPAVTGLTSLEEGDDPVRPSPLTSRPLQPWPDCGILGLSAGLYSLQLQHWLAHFKPAQFLVVSFEALRGGKATNAGGRSSSGSGSSRTATELGKPQDLHRALLERIVRFAADSNSHQAAAARDLLLETSSNPVPIAKSEGEESGSATAAAGARLKERRVASFSHFAHDNATPEDLAALQQYFSPFNRELQTLLERERIQIAPDGISAFDLVANWEHN